MANFSHISYRTCEVMGSLFVTRVLENLSWNMQQSKAILTVNCLLLGLYEVIRVFCYLWISSGMDSHTYGRARCWVIPSCVTVLPLTWNINLVSEFTDKMYAREGDIGAWGEGRHLRYSCFNISFLLVMFCFVLDCPWEIFVCSQFIPF